MGYYFTWVQNYYDLNVGFLYFDFRFVYCASRITIFNSLSVRVKSYLPGVYTDFLLFSFWTSSSTSNEWITVPLLNVPNDIYVCSKKPKASCIVIRQITMVRFTRSVDNGQQRLQKIRLVELNQISKRDDTIKKKNDKHSKHM